MDGFSTSLHSSSAKTIRLNTTNSVLLWCRLFNENVMDLGSVQWKRLEHCLSNEKKHFIKILKPLHIYIKIKNEEVKVGYNLISRGKTKLSNGPVRPLWEW